ncbi:MAG: hypothetical protein KGZ58_04190, partial [Ignavibacteriales bacterium]|nr:hypothetical protein [Ignavibacteriales bacterium]
MSSSIAVKFVLVFMFIAPVLQSQNESAQHQKEIKVWHDTRMTSLKKDYGWLTLVALDWLQEGKNDIKEIGTISLSKETITLIINNN